MAKLSLTPREYIQKSFSPCVAVMGSSFVDEVCQKNNLSFIELLDPFSTLDKEGNEVTSIHFVCLETEKICYSSLFLNLLVSFRDPSGSIIMLRDLQIILSDVNQKPPEAAIARRLLNESVICDFDNIETTTIKSGELGGFILINFHIY